MPSNFSFEDALEEPKTFSYEDANAEFVPEESAAAIKGIDLPKITPPGGMDVAGLAGAQAGEGNPLAEFGKELIQAPSQIVGGVVEPAAAYALNVLTPKKDQFRMDFTSGTEAPPLQMESVDRFEAGKPMLNLQPESVIKPDSFMGKALTSFSTPGQVAMLGGGEALGLLGRMGVAVPGANAIAKGAAGLFGADMAIQAPQSIYKAIQTGNREDIDEAINQVAMAGWMGHSLTKGKPNARQIEEATKVHGDVRPREESAKGVSEQGGGEGVQSQAQGVAQKAQVPLSDIQSWVERNRNADSADVVKMFPQLSRPEAARLIASIHGITSVGPDGMPKVEYPEFEPDKVKNIGEIPLSEEEMGHLLGASKGIEHPVEVVSVHPDHANAGDIAWADRKSGKIRLNLEQYKDWLKNIPPERRGEAVASLLGEEQIHMATSDQHALGYWNTLTKAEKLINNRRYSGKWGTQPELTDTHMGAEALRFRIQQLSKMTPREIAEAVGRERWTVQGLTAVESAIRGIRERLGTKATKEASSILDRVEENLHIARTAASQYNFGAKRKEDPVPEGYVRLYQGSGGAEGAGSAGSSWARSIDRASTYGKNIQFVDVPKNVADAGSSKAKAAGIGGDTVLLDQEWAKQGSPHSVTEQKSWDIGGEEEPQGIEQVLQNQPGETTHQTMESLSDADAARFFKERGRPQRDSVLYGMKLDESSVPELEKLRDEAAKKAMDAIQSGDSEAAMANFGKNVWYSGAIEGARKSGPNFDAVRGEKDSQFAARNKKDIRNEVPPDLGMWLFHDWLKGQGFPQDYVEGEYPSHGQIMGLMKELAITPKEDWDLPEDIKKKVESFWANNKDGNFSRRNLINTEISNAYEDARLYEDKLGYASSANEKRILRTYLYETLQHADRLRKMLRAEDEADIRDRSNPSLPFDDFAAKRKDDPNQQDLFKAGPSWKGSPTPGKSYEKTRPESADQPQLFNPAVGSYAGKKVPRKERELPAGAIEPVPTITPQVMEKTVGKYLNMSAEDRGKIGLSKLPNFKDFTQWLKDNEFRGTAGQVRELWEDAVWKNLNQMTGENLTKLKKGYKLGRQIKIPKTEEGEWKLNPQEANRLVGQLNRIPEAKIPDPLTPEEQRLIGKQKNITKLKITGDQMYQSLKKTLGVGTPGTGMLQDSAKEIAEVTQAFKDRMRDVIPALEKKQKIRSRAIALIGEHLLRDAYAEAKPINRKTVAADDLAYGKDTFVDIGNDIANAPGVLGRVLTQGAGSNRTGKNALPVSATKRLTAMIDKKTGKVHLVSTFYDPAPKTYWTKARGYYVGERGAVVLDPASPSGEHTQIKAALARYRPVASILLDEPVQKFHQTFDNFGQFMDEIGRDAKERSDVEQPTVEEPSTAQENVESKMFPGEQFSADVVPEYAQGEEATPQGQIPAEQRPGRGAVTELGRNQDLSGNEAQSIYNHLNDETGGSVESIDDVKAALLAMKDFADPKKFPKIASAVSGYRKLARNIQRTLRSELFELEKERSQLNRRTGQLEGRQFAGENLNHDQLVQMASDLDRMEQLDNRIRELRNMSVDNLINYLSARIYDTYNKHVTPEDFVKRTMEAGAASNRPTTPTQPEGPVGSKRELTAPERVPPTVVRPEQVPPGSIPEQAFVHHPGLNEPPSKPKQVMLSEDEMRHVDELVRKGTGKGEPEPTPEEKEIIQRYQQQREQAEKQFIGPKPNAKVTPHEHFEDVPPAKGKYTLAKTPPELGLQVWIRQKEPAAFRKFKEKANEDFEKQKRVVAATLTRRETKNNIAGALDGAFTLANNYARESGNSVRVHSKDPKVRAAAKAYIAAHGIEENLHPLLQQSIQGMMKAELMMNSRNILDRRVGRAWFNAAKRLRDEVEWVKANWNNPDMRDVALAVRTAMKDEFDFESKNGVRLSEKEDYMPGRYEAEFFDDDSVRFSGYDVLGRNFRKPKVFKDYYQAISDGPYIPKNYDAADLVEHRVRQGRQAVNKDLWLQGLKDVTDPHTGKPVAADQVEFKGKMRPPNDEYDAFSLGPNKNPIAVRKGYKSFLDALTSQSPIQNNPVGATALAATGAMKHGVILIMDTFHPARLLQYGLAAGPRSIYRLGGGGWTALDFRPEDIPNAIRQGYVSPESAAWADGKVNLKNSRGEPVQFTRREILKEAQRLGLNVGRISDALYQDTVRNIPVIGKFNKLVFDKITRGLMAQMAVLKFEEFANKHPNVPYERLLRDIVKDTNNYYGSIGRQGIFKSQAFRDAAQLVFLAPQWVEGLITKEMAFAGRVTGVSNLMGRRGLPQLGVIGQGVGRGLAAYFVMTQIMNLITRGHTTFQNEEEGHKLDAWIPTGDGEGFWLSPMSVFAEVTHDIMRLAETKPNTWDAIRQVGENKLGPWGRFGMVLATDKSPTGDRLTTSPSILGTAISQAAPAPISLGTPARAAAHAMFPDKVSPPPRGALLRQLTASLMGIKMQPGQSSTAQISEMAKQFMKENNLNKQTSVIEQTDDPSYVKFRAALRNNDPKQAKAMLEGLRKNHTDKEITKDMKVWLNRGFTGGTKGEERMFMASLDNHGISLYNKAQEERQKTYEKFLNFWIQHSGARDQERP